MATITIRGDYHVLNWTDKDTGERRHKSLGKVGTLPKKDLDDILRIKGYELSTGARLLNVHRRPAPRFEDFVRGTYLPWHRSEYPDSHYRVEQIALDHLVPHFTNKPMNLITVKEAEDYKTRRRFLAKASTVTKEVRTLHAIINRAVDLKELTDNPISIVEAPQNLDSKPHRWYSSDELALLYTATTLYVDPKYAPIWKLFANTGMRRSEGLILRALWVLDAKIRLVSTGEERTKDGEWREIPRTDGANEALAAIRASGLYVLPRMRHESLSRAYTRCARAAGLDGSLQTLRHTYICHMLLAGVPIRTVQLYAGHAHITTTEGYAYQVLREDPDAAVRLAI